MLAECRVLPLLGDIDYLLRSMFELQQQYWFFYVDTLEIVRAFPEIAEKHKLLLQTQRQQTDFMLEFNSSRGSFKQPSYQGQFVDLGHIFCMSMDNWLAYQHINGNQDVAVIVLKGASGEILEIDSRSSDALALAARQKCSIRIDSALFNDISFEDKEQKERREKLQKYSLAQLQVLLTDTLAKEDYETAGMIRDIINERT